MTKERIQQSETLLELNRASLIAVVKENPGIDLPTLTTKFRFRAGKLASMTAKLLNNRTLRNIDGGLYHFSKRRSETEQFKLDKNLPRLTRKSLMAMIRRHPGIDLPTLTAKFRFRAGRLTRMVLQEIRKGQIKDESGNLYLA